MMGHINKPSFKKLQKVASPTRIYVAASQPGSEPNTNKFNIPVDPHHEEQNQTRQPPKHANLETSKKSPEKPGDWDLKPGDFQNMC